MNDDDTSGSTGGHQRDTSLTYSPPPVVTLRSITRGVSEAFHLEFQTDDGSWMD